MLKIVRNDVDNSAPADLHKKLSKSGHQVIGVTYHEGDLIVELEDGTDEIAVTHFINSHTGYNVELAKDALKARVNLYRDGVVHDRFPHEIAGTTYYFDADNRSAIRLDGVYATAVFFKTFNLPLSLNYRDADNFMHTLDGDGVISLFKSASNYETSNIFKAAYIKDTLIESMGYDSTEEYDAIDALTLWDNTQWPLI